MKPFLTAILLLLFFSTVLAHGVSDADKHMIVGGGLIEYLWLGAKHMITGYDHLLFLLGVVFFLDTAKDIIKFVTAFTIGHSITLIFATFMSITASHHMVDAIIALTVVYKGFDNLDGFKRLLNINAPNLLLLVFIFGLIHGFGLSTRLQELSLEHEGLLLKIISFNVGVEMGQMAALAIMLPVLAALRNRNFFPTFSRAANIGLIFAGFFLFALQIYDYVDHRQQHALEHAQQEQLHNPPE